MIRFEGRYDEYSYRVANMPLHKSCNTVEEGQFVTIKEGALVLAGKDSKKAFLAIGSKRVGRDQVSGKASGNVSFLHGNSIVMSDQFNTSESYGDDMTPLTVVNGVVEPSTTETDLIVGYAIGQPVNGFLKIMI